MAKEIQYDDIDWAKVAAWRHAALRNPIIGQVLERKGGRLLKTHIRLRDVPRKYRKALLRIMNNA